MPCFVIKVLCVVVSAEELDEVQRHQGLLGELQRLADDGTHKVTFTNSCVFIALFTARRHRLIYRFIYVHLKLMNVNVTNASKRILPSHTSDDES